MQLTLAYHPVNSIGFGERLSLDGTALTVNQDELRAIVLEDPLIDAVDFAVAAPN
ncbi:MAG: glycine/sarcosine/betaine reductase component B subunit, partial [Candidatus Binatia bacterium]